MNVKRRKAVMVGSLIEESVGKRSTEVEKVNVAEAYVPEELRKY